MKRIMFSMLVLALCLCACGRSEDELLTKPAAALLPAEQPAVMLPVEGTEEPAAAEPKPWEVEFREEDYRKLSIPQPNGDRLTIWREQGVLGAVCRKRYETAISGDVEDCYYYPNGVISHRYVWFEKNMYCEEYFQDNGHVLMDIIIDGEGERTERYFYDNGVAVDEDSPVWGTTRLMKILHPDGVTEEYHYLEDGRTIKTCFGYPDEGAYYETEFYENGSEKYRKDQNPQCTTEVKYDEEGYCTFYYNKSNESGYEVRCIADDTGKLVQVVEDGTVYEDESVLAHFAASYNFRQ